ncbi:hypothetical protein VNI00_017549 [Paramarasmius palmivorus]|uniref:Carrier domain-containing protein n=1 Tax=Paramarasmius palmivorus TaxID=297713 RepID=A0AAW0B717_9AGAR
MAFARPNSRVVLHARDFSPAALATLAYLQERRFDIFVTASDPSVPLSQKDVSSSHDVESWSRAVRRWAGDGVDYIFNFEEDDAILAVPVERMSSQGTIVQIGNIYPKQLRPGQQFVSVGFERVFSGVYNVLEEALPTTPRQIMSRLSPSSLIFQADALELAHSKAALYKDMSILLDFETLPENMTVIKPGRAPGSSAFNPRASYVITGGIGGLGCNIARLLVESGARHVILTSRSGWKAFENGRMFREKKIIEYLRTLPGVTIDVVACDCLDEVKTKTLFSNLPNVAGIFYVAVRLNDSLFTNLTTREEWEKVYDVKVKGVHVLLDAVDPKKLDFLVLTSSMATVCGSPGQANYSAAQTEMEAMTSKIPNCISVTVPPLTDSGVFVRSMPTENARSAALDKYKDLGMTGYTMARHCVDAIWTLGIPAYNPLYISSIQWKKVMEMMPDYLQSSMRHLLVKESSEGAMSNGPKEQNILAAAAAVLSLEPDRVEENVPLSAYGLDSLTSVRLSGILKAYFSIEVTQLQLLSQTTSVARLHQLQEEQQIAAAAAAASASVSDSTPVEAEQIQTNVHEADLDKIVVRLNTATEGTPLFIMHGAGGGIVDLVKAAQKVHYPIFGVQDTPEAPITGTIHRLAEFYLSKIQEKQPHGPYRLAGLSFGTCLAQEIAQLLVKQGEVVESLVMLDGSPTLFSAAFQLYSMSRIHDGSIRNDVQEVVNDMVSSGTLDNSDDLGEQFADHFRRAEEGGSGPKWIARFCMAYIAHVLIGIRRGKEFLNAIGEAGGKLEVNWPSKRTVLVRALDGVRSQPYAARVSQYFDLDRYVDGVEKYDLPGTHFGILAPDSGLDAILDKLF